MYHISVTQIETMSDVLSVTDKTIGETTNKSIFNIKYWVEKHGVKKSDIPRTLIYFKVVTYVSWLSMWALCYRFKPAHKLMQYKWASNTITKLKQRYPNAYLKYQTKTEKISNNEYFKKIPTSIGLKSKRFTESFMESLVVNKLALPVTIPTYIYIAASLVRARNEKPNDIQKDSPEDVQNNVPI